MQSIGFSSIPRRWWLALAFVALFIFSGGELARADPGVRSRALLLDGLTGPALERFAFGVGTNGALRGLMEAGVYTRCENAADTRCARTHDGPRHEKGFRWDTASGWAGVISGMNTSGHGVAGNLFEWQSAFAEASLTHPTFFKRPRDRGLRTAAAIKTRYKAWTC